LIPLLQPIGDFRREHVLRSKGKCRAGKAKKKVQEESMPEWMPAIYDHLTIGYNSTGRTLEALARSRQPPNMLAISDAEGRRDPATKLAAVFVCRKSLPEMMTSSLPMLLATSAPKATRARLVDISPQAEAKLAQALNQPRVGILGLQEDAPGSDALLRFVTENLDPVEVPWLEQACSFAYFPANIKIIETTRNPTSTTPSLKRRKMEREKDDGNDT
jgi:ribonuclease P/MRP protein subunit POP3